MGDFFDPAAPLEDFSAREEALKRLLARANVLRGTTPLGINPEENMVSGHFVTPWAKLAQMAINPISAAIMDNSALENLQALNRDKSAAAREIIDQLPRSADGDINVDDRGAIAKLALLASEKGLIPREEGIAKIFETLLRPKSVNPFAGLSSPVIRDENGNMVPNPVIQQNKDAESERHVQDALRIDSIKRQRKAEEAANAPKKASETLQEIQAIKTMDKLDNGEPLPKDERSFFETKHQYLSDLDALMGSYQPEYSANPVSQRVANTLKGMGFEGLGTTVGAMASGTKEQTIKDAANWWARMEQLYNAAQRHELYGAALSATEKPLFEQQTLNPGSSPETVIKFFKEARERGIQDLATHGTTASQEYDTGGVKKSFEDVYGGSNVIPLHQSIVPQRSSAAAVEQATDTREPDNDTDDGDYGDLPEEAKGDKQVTRKYAPGTVVDRIRNQPMQEVITKSGKKFRILPPLER